MELAPVDVALTFEVTFDSPTLPVAMSVYDNSTGTPVLVHGPTAMTNAVGNTYVGVFTPPNQHPYLVFKAVYTSSSFLTLSSNYSQGSESFIAQVLGGSSSSNSEGCTAVGYVVSNSELVGYVQD